MQEFEMTTTEKNEMNFDETGSASLRTSFVKDQALTFRCPTCTKLYEVNSRQIKSSSPHFDCLVCAELFTFSFPPKNWQKIETQAVASRNPASQKLDKACPKCSAMNLSSAQECYSCQIVFKNYEILKHEDYPNALPSLVTAWKNYVSHYENIERREKFIQSCASAGQLDYARKKFQTLQKVMGIEDPHSLEALAQIDRLGVNPLESTTLKTMDLKETLVSFQQIIGKALITFLKQKRVKYWGPVAVAILLLLIGNLNPLHRNMIGPGVAVLILHFGLIFMVKGRISASDFLQK